MFEIVNAQPVKLANYNPRSEKHGKQHKPAADLMIEAGMSASALDLLQPGLRESLYKAAEDQADLVEPDRNALTARRFQRMSPFAWGWEGKGYMLTIDYGLGGDSNIELDDCTVKDVRISPQEGGTVLFKFRVVAHPDEHDSGILTHRIQQEITITLRAPAPQTVGELFGESPEPQQEPETEEQD
ncbi:hypothetical protein E5S69_11765 [Cupriavidus necator]|uniref:hypothetical protein n=1 Tax=Cupriavidus necator TaxID=106590 RepID=UPI00148F6114|nr:hypothetical protein [Cupriavidus necator]NOV24188.1 hypothetical protein [Cupriavidus necator]